MFDNGILSAADPKEDQRGKLSLCLKQLRYIIIKKDNKAI
jgi:hypothetical protein